MEECPRVSDRKLGKEVVMGVGGLWPGRVTRWR